MYIPPYYKNENIEEVHSFIKDHSFGILVNITDGKPWATHIPLELETVDNKPALVGHIAKANPQWQAFKDHPQVLCIFNGPHAYISSSLYNEEEVPTWDYIAVHVYGTLHIMNEEQTMEALHRLVDRHETTSEKPLSLHDLSAKTLRQVKGVVGFYITVDTVQAAYKLSQTRPEDHAAIIANLNQQGVTEQEIARHIKQQSKNTSS